MCKNEFLTVINDIAQCDDMKELSAHFSHEKILNLVHRYKESSGKTDAGRGNIFFDKGLCCSQNLGRHTSHYGLAVPRPRSVNSRMAISDKTFCNKTEMLLYKVTKKIYP